MDGYVGIDVSKGRLDVLLVRDSKREGQQFTNTPSGYEKLHVCLEATGSYGEAVAEYLDEQGYTVSVVNPARIKGYAASQMQRNKTDKLDAALIADFCRTQHPPAWTPPAPEMRHLQQLVRHLDDLTRACQVAKNHLEDQTLGPVLVEHWQVQISLLKAQIAQTQHAISDVRDPAS